MDVFRMPYQVRTLKEAVLKTLAFFDIFHHPLTFEELKRYLLHFSPDSHRMKAFLDVSSFIEEAGGFYFLAGHEDAFFRRTSFQKTNERLWKKVRKFSFLFRMIPFVKMVAVCNRLAFHGANDESDIDLFLITSSKRLFFVRSFFIFFLTLFGVRLKGKKVAGKFCLGFIVSEDMMDLSPLQEKPYDIYLAYWVATLAPVLGFQTYMDFLNKNEWVKKFFVRGVRPRTDDFLQERSFIKNFLEWIFSGRLGDLLEKFFMDIQYKKALKTWNSLGRPHGIVLGTNILKFHHPDKRSEIRDFWEEKIASFTF